MLSLASCFRLLLSLYRRLLVMFSLTNLCENTGLCARTLKSAKCTVKGLAFLNFNLRHLYPPSLRVDFKLAYYIGRPLISQTLWL